MGELSNQPKRRGRPPKIKPEVVDDVRPEGNDARGTDEGSIQGEQPGRVEIADRPLSVAQERALDRDHDGEPGGSWPHASLTEPQKAAWVQEAIDAHESQTELKRVDAFNRVWTFRHEVVKNHLHLMIHCKRGPKEAQRLLSVAWMPRDVIDGVINELDAEMAR